MRSCEPDGGALPLDGFGRARDGGRKADAVLGIAHVVVHRFRNGDDLETLGVQARGVAQRIVAADGDQVIEAQRFHVLQHAAGHVEDGRGDALLGHFGLGKLPAFTTGGRAFILAGLVRELCR